MPLGLPPLRIGLAASALHRAAPNSALFRLVTERTMCISDRASADAWVASCERRQQQPQRIA
jgi:hypothetical protein